MPHPQVSPQPSIRLSQCKRPPTGLRKGTQPRGVSPAMDQGPLHSRVLHRKELWLQGGRQPWFIAERCSASPWACTCYSCSFWIEQGEERWTDPLTTPLSSKVHLPGNSPSLLWTPKPAGKAEVQKHLWNGNIAAPSKAFFLFSWDIFYDNYSACKADRFNIYFLQTADFRFRSLCMSHFSNRGSTQGHLTHVVCEASFLRT